MGQSLCSLLWILNVFSEVWATIDVKYSDIMKYYNFKWR